jgi:hypothetical protein
MTAARLTFPHKVTGDQLLATEVEQIRDAIGDHAELLDLLATQAGTAAQALTLDQAQDILRRAPLTADLVPGWLYPLTGPWDGGAAGQVVAVEAIAPRAFAAAGTLTLGNVATAVAVNVGAGTTGKLGAAGFTPIPATANHPGFLTQDELNTWLLDKLTANTPAPTIASFSPTTAMRGGQVVITGSYFTGATEVTVATAAVDSFTVDSDTQITAVLAAGQATGTLRVKTPGGIAASSQPLVIAGTPGVGAIGDLYNRTSWPDLSGLETSAGWAALGGKLVKASGSDEYIRLATATTFDEWSFEVTMRLVQTSPSNFGGGLKLQPLTPGRFELSFYVLSKTGDPDFGRLYVYEPGRVSLPGPTIPNFAEGDTYTSRLECTPTAFVFTVIHKSQAYVLRAPITYDPSGYAIGTFKPCIFSYEGGYEVTAWRYGSSMQRGGRWLQSDSLGKGFHALSYNARFATKAGLKAHCGPGDTTQDALATTYELVSASQPGKLFLMLGTNNVFDAVYRQQLASLVNQYDAAGIPLVLISPIARVGSNKKDFLDYLLATYPGRVIDAYTPTAAPNSTDLNPAYDSSDGVHMNPAGHQVVADTILASPLY